MEAAQASRKEAGGSGAGNQPLPPLLLPAPVTPARSDDMAFEELAGTASADVLACNMEGVPTDESNLVIKVS